MARPEIIKILKEKNSDLSHSDFENIIDNFCLSLEKALIKGNIVEIRGFGTFFIKKIKEKYSARNPKTGEIIYVPQKNKIRFKPSKKLNEIINK